MGEPAFGATRVQRDERTPPHHRPMLTATGCRGTTDGWLRHPDNAHRTGDPVRSRCVLLGEHGRFHHPRLQVSPADRRCGTENHRHRRAACRGSRVAVRRHGPPRISARGCGPTSGPTSASSTRYPESCWPGCGLRGGPADLAGPLTIDRYSTIVAVRRAKQGAAFRLHQGPRVPPAAGDLRADRAGADVPAARWRPWADRGAASFLTETISRTRTAGATATALRRTVFNMPGRLSTPAGADDYDYDYP